ncbi:MAG: DUF2946 family protein [Telluria sp.]
MDDIVKQAMAKWPNVPHCYGWLRLDARGAWRMRDERAQHVNLPGDKLTNAALVGFIARNYARDERGCWYFQNGPQRVYVQLEAAPFVARTDPQHGVVLHTGAPLAPERAYLTELGALLLVEGEVVAQVDDRDAGALLAQVEQDGAALDDEALLAWLARPRGTLALRVGAGTVPLDFIESTNVAPRFGFIPNPQAPSSS